MSVGIIDYGIGNMRSISNMLNYLRIPNQIAHNAVDLSNNSALILPGVGAFGSVMTALEVHGLTRFVKDWAEEGKMLVGICAGMQMLGICSEESEIAGLGIVPVSFKRFSGQDGNQLLPVPHMGWNYVSCNERDPALSQLPDNSRFYFVHSFYAHNVPKNMILMQSQYGESFTAAYRRNNIYGFQFHPEKSHRFGIALFRGLFADFVRIENR